MNEVNVTSMRGKVLIVDDIPANCKLVARHLERDNYVTIAAHGGAQALQLIEREVPDLVLLDIMMSGVDGMEVLRKVRQDFSPAQLPVVMVTARDATEDIVLALKLGANDYVTKPLSIPVLMARVHTQISLRMAARQLEHQAKELARSNEELEEFAFAASHDLRAPLRAISNLSEWLEEDMGDSLTDESREHLTLLKRRVHRMEKLVDDLLTYARINKQSDAPQDVNVRELINDIVFVMAPPEQFVVHASDPLPNITTAQAPLEQVIRNLISNAIKHHDRASGRIEISAIENGDYCEFVIADDGPGIPDEFHKRVFKRFHTLKPRDEKEGSGMGLAFVKRIVELNSGRVWLEPNTGRGTTFHFTWPVSSNADTVIA